MGPLAPAAIQDRVRAALTEDLGTGDATTLALIPGNARARAQMVAREPLVVSGLPLALAAFRELAPDLNCHACLPEGTHVTAGTTVLDLEGPARALLTAERVALNFVQRLSGIATLTATFVAAIEGTPARILDTRKTTPGWRALEKYAVQCGGGTNHRRGLDDLILIKDNHLAALRQATPNPVAAAVDRARRERPHLKIEVEADTLDQVAQAVEARADFVLLDNMSLDDLRAAVALCRGRVLTEASGGIRLDNAREIALTGVDFLSVGALTHSARSVDLGLDFLS